jgi:hypothetical protein
MQESKIKTVCNVINVCYDSIEKSLRKRVFFLIESIVRPLIEKA